jgi:heme/copper-type cytochrome/quinol oxidase subunit 3
LSESFTPAEHYPGPAHTPVHTGAGYAGQSGTPHAHHPHHPKLQHHFDDMDQQAEASTLGMWVFLVTEFMFFGGLFMAYIVYRAAQPGRSRRRARTSASSGAASTPPC